MLAEDPEGKFAESCASAAAIFQLSGQLSAPKSRDQQSRLVDVGGAGWLFAAFELRREEMSRPLEHLLRFERAPRPHVGQAEVVEEDFTVS
jgi:hypothetical protein